MSESNLEERLEDLERQISLINDRNVKVERDKAWEISKFRIFSVCVLTWMTIGLVFLAIGVVEPAINAIIPAIGFYLSTQSLPLLKKWWLGRN